MAVKINGELKTLIADPSTLKVIASVDMEGRPHVTVKGSLDVTDDGSLRYLEFFENSRTNKNLLASLWYEKQVAVNIVAADKRSFQIKGRVVRSVIAGREFEKQYVLAQTRDPQNDLSSIYIIEADEVIEQTYRVRREEEAKKNPLYVHLDRLTKQEGV
jgi:hypothetical protein